MSRCVWNSRTERSNSCKSLRKKILQAMFAELYPKEAKRGQYPIRNADLCSAISKAQGYRCEAKRAPTSKKPKKKSARRSSSSSASSSSSKKRSKKGGRRKSSTSKSSKSSKSAIPDSARRLLDSFSAIAKEVGRNDVTLTELNKLYGKASNLKKKIPHVEEEIARANLSDKVRKSLERVLDKDVDKLFDNFKKAKKYARIMRYY